MTSWIKRISIVLGVFVVTYFALGLFFVNSVSQREETWHDEAVANTQPVTMKDWIATAHQGQPVIELRYRPVAGRLFVVRIYDDRDFVIALHPGSSDATPLSIDTGRISPHEKLALTDAVAALYAAGETGMEPESAAVRTDLLLTLLHQGKQRMRYRYRTSDHHTLPIELQQFDLRLHSVMQSWALKPPHGYARTPIELTYDESTVAALVRGLESSREDLHSSVAARLAEIGDAALPELTRVLREGEAARYQPASRYVAVVDSIGKLGVASGEGYELIEALAAGEASLPGERRVQSHARAVVKRNGGAPR